MNFLRDEYEAPAEQSVNGLQKIIMACDDENELLGARVDYLLKRLDQQAHEGDAEEIKRLNEIIRDNAKIIRVYSEELALRTATEVRS